jgi:hypothetical protein
VQVVKKVPQSTRLQVVMVWAMSAATDGSHRPAGGVMVNAAIGWHRAKSRVHKLPWFKATSAVLWATFEIRDGSAMAGSVRPLLTLPHMHEGIDQCDCV